jgi:hypothetical protein
VDKLDQFFVDLLLICLHEAAEVLLEKFLSAIRLGWSHYVGVWVE